MEKPSPLGLRAILAWYRFLDDFMSYPDRYREADGPVDNDVCYTRGCGYPAAYNGRCWACNAGRRLPS